MAVRLYRDTGKTVTILGNAGEKVLAGIDACIVLDLNHYNMISGDSFPFDVL